MNILPQLLRDLLSIGFWSRIFQWKFYRQKIAEALAELQVIQNRYVHLQSDLTECRPLCRLAALQSTVPV
jgi:hypothetical protein